jgi:ribonuclease HIII
MLNKTSFTYVLSGPQQTALERLLRTGNFRTIPMEHTRIAAQTPDCTIALYKSGKCLVQGKGAEEFVTFTLEPSVLGTVGVGYEEILNPEMVEPRMGVDESGKGDFFGPMVIAAAYCDATLVDAMREMDVKDSKRITSDKKALELGRKLRDLLGKRFALIRIGPAAYNRLYAQMRSVNRILAWGHARAIENLLEVVPQCPKAISDQFGSKSQVEKALMKKGRQIQLVQRHKAESDLAVAAASILAREEFLRSLHAMKEEFKTEIPKGASEMVREAAASLVRARGASVLLQTSKCHFRTTDQILQATGHSRSELGPEGQIVSKVYDADRFRKPKSDA